MADLSMSVVIVIGISGLTFIAVCAFFLLIFWQEAQEFTENPLLTETATKSKVALPGGNETSPSVSGSVEVSKTGIYAKNKAGRKMGKSVGTGSWSSGDSSLCASSVTLEMAIADSGSSESIARCTGCHGRNGTGSETSVPETRDCGHFNPGFSIV